MEQSDQSNKNENETTGWLRGKNKKSDNQERSVLSAPLLSLLCFVLMAILSGLYIWFVGITTPPAEFAPKAERPSVEENKEPESTTARAKTDISIQALSPSDEIGTIESDLETTNLDELEQELSALDEELNIMLSR